MSVHEAGALHAPGYGAASGTVTRVITEGYGAKADEPPSTGFELRASWCPADDEIEDEVCGAGVFMGTVIIGISAPVAGQVRAAGEGTVPARRSVRAA